jgi:hypothetical protein
MPRLPSVARFLYGNRPYALEHAPALPPIIPWPAATAGTPSGRRQIPSMMFPNERDILFSIAKSYYTGAGDIIDAGIFFGASTFCFCQGLVCNPIYEEKSCIHSYDMAPMNAGTLRWLPDIGQVGSDYGAYLGQLIRSWDYRGTVKLHIGDINKMDYEGKVEVLFLDILKSRSTLKKCNALFMNHLIPGRSIVIQQDYYWHQNWYINAYMELLRDYFLIVDSAETSCIFINTKKIPKDMLTEDMLVDLSETDIVGLLDSCKGTAHSLFQYMMTELCVVTYAMEIRSMSLARERLQIFDVQFGRVLQEPRGASFNRLRHAHTWLTSRLSA